jgi:hypothetical protein
VIELTEFDKFKKLKSVKDRTWIAVQKKDLHQYPVPKLIEIFLKDNFFDSENKD